MKKSRIKFLTIGLVFFVLAVIAYLRYNPQSVFERKLEEMGYTIIERKTRGINEFAAPPFEKGDCVVFKGKKHDVVRYAYIEPPIKGPAKFVYRIENKKTNKLELASEEKLKSCN